MKQKILSILLALILCLTAVTPVFAQTIVLTDDADLLSQSEKRDIQEQLDALSVEFDVDIAVITVETTGRYDPEIYIEHLYDEGGYGSNGVMLLVAMEQREYMILSNGWCSDAISPSRIDAIVDAMQEDMADGEYAQAFDTFLEKCRYYLDGHINGFPFKFGQNLLICLIVGLVVALIVTGVMRSKLKSVKKQYTANPYTKPGSMQVTRATDLYLYSNVTRVRRAQSSSGSGSRGGGGRSVGGGRF